MLNLFFHTQLQLGLAQAAIAAMAAMIVVLLARRRNIHLEGEALIAMLRGLVQIIAVGSILVILLRGSRWTSGLLLTAMIVAAGATSAKRAKNIPGAFWVSAWSIALGAGLVIAVMTFLGVIDTAITSLVPVGSMLIANAMNTNGLALNRFRSDVLAHVGEIETAFALGAEARTSVSPYVQASFEASLIPAHRFAALSGHRVDSGSDGRNVAFWRQAGLCGHLPVRGAGHDLRGFRTDLADQHLAHSGTECFLRPSSFCCNRADRAARISRIVTLSMNKISSVILEHAKAAEHHRRVAALRAVASLELAKGLVVLAAWLRRSFPRP